MNEMMKSLRYQTKANDVDEKGIVTIAVNGIGIEDSQKDISMPGSFNKTLVEDMPRMRHFLNHDPTQLLGVPLSGKEEDGNLVMVSQLNLKKQIGRDVLEDYKLYAENGRTLEHSIGVQAMKRDNADKRKVRQWKMFEFSTLTSWGSNPQTFLVDIKSATADRVRDAIEFIRKAMNGRGYSDERLKSYNMQLDLLLKSLMGDTIVTCPHCGYQFDYDAYPEQTFSQQVIESAAQYASWFTDDIVRQEMEKLKPEIRAGVAALLDTFKGERGEFTEKSITDLMHFVRCPHCWARVYRANSILIDDAAAEKSCGGDDDDDDDDDEMHDEPDDERDECKKSSETDFFTKLNESII